MSVAVNGERGPIATVVVFAVDDDFTFYFATHVDTYKAKALASDNRMSLSVWENKKMLVQADGRAQEVRVDSERDSIFEKLAVSAAGIPDFWPPILRLRGSKYVVYKVKLSWLRTMDLRNISIYASDSPFTEINFLNS